MAEVVTAFSHSRHNSMVFNNDMSPNVGTVELLPNPDFRFPMQPANPTASIGRRPVSMQFPANRTRGAAQRSSVSALPAFSFNSSDTSGLSKDASGSTTEGPTSPTSPTKAMRHRRGASEFIGGDGRFGTTGLISTSPTKQTSALPIPEASSSGGSPAGRRGHAHRRSTAISSHDVSAILYPKDANLQLQSNSAPATPFEEMPAFQVPVQFTRATSQSKLPQNSSSSFAQEMDDARPRSRRLVGFKDNVEYIPRPLSTISSGTESSMSTIKGHSGTNSISSMLSLASASPSPARLGGRRSLSTTAVDSPKLGSPPASVKRAETEGGWPKNEGKRPLPDSAATSPNLSIATDASSIVRPPSRKKNFLGLDRRRSEPSMSAAVASDAESHLSATSLQEPAGSHISFKASNESLKDKQSLQRKSSTRKVKQWATAIIPRKMKGSKRAKSIDLSSLKSASPVSEPSPALSQQPVAQVSTDQQQVPLTEPDLDAIFGVEPSGDDDNTIAKPAFSQPRIEISTVPSAFSSHGRQNSDNMSSPVIDLDAASGPWGTPSMGLSSSLPPRRQLHSSRLNRDFVGPGMHYHRRAESAPALVPFEHGRSGSPSQSPMDDVFEEDEEEEDGLPIAPLSLDDKSDEEFSVGISVVDTAVEQSGPGFNWGFEDGGLGIQPGRVTPFAQISRLGTPPMQRRPSSIVEETIMEESSPVEIVEDYEEPRTSSLTKSSDSSDTPTLTPGSIEPSLAVAQTHPSHMTPSSYQASAFSSPDFTRRQGSFDMTSRLGTSASSATDNRTLSSFATGEPGPEIRMSVDDVPSLTSSRSTMVTMHNNGSRRDFSDRSGSIASAAREEQLAEHRRKRSSIQSLSKLMTGSFRESKTHLPTEERPHTANTVIGPKDGKKKEHRLSKWMFWKGKQSARNFS
ncbi:hypothetical protein M8818_002024 [Zalaria obscura]|uniref:Uncharacterized protein n=1 Tax=Zalaria obscura TaxID=2024903 RepID=A0ACC3SJB4_9PEZI